MRGNWLAKKLPQGLADKVKAGLLESQYPGAETGPAGKPDETCNLVSKVITIRDDPKASNQEHASVRGGKGTNGAPEIGLETSILLEHEMA